MGKFLPFSFTSKYRTQKTANKARCSFTSSFSEWAVSLPGVSLIATDHRSSNSHTLVYLKHYIRLFLIYSL